MLAVFFFVAKKKLFDRQTHRHMKKKSRPFSIKFRTHQKEYRAQLRCAYNELLLK